MKTQISRESFQPDKRYSGVYEQQGRMLTDADWNELVTVLKGELAASLVDVVGNGSPAAAALSISQNAGKQLLIQPGDIYVDGIQASLPGKAAFPIGQQGDLGDLPGYPQPASTGPYVIYADAWERTVTALEDPKLTDVALHGADTCTRTQTMVQVKCCPEKLEPETDLPKTGSALLSLALNANFEASDPCDPCAGLVPTTNGRVGNYLFRVEIHEVKIDNTNDETITFKWSSENGAEQYGTKQSLPPGFVTSDYVYEFYDVSDEKQLGVFLLPGFQGVPSFQPSRPALSNPFPATVPDKPFVRRWDGFCTVKRAGGAWSFSTGFDRGVILSTDPARTRTPGFVCFPTPAELQIQLKALQLNLILGGATFLAGDYWLAEVRESSKSPGTSILNKTAPAGIVHHYLRLARIDKDGNLKLYDNDADTRRHNFPPLTNLRARDIGYKAQCSKGLYNGFDGNVQQALDKICGLSAQDVAFEQPCETGIYSGTVGPGATKVTTVAEALQLLCNIQAGQISYQPASSCTYLSSQNVNNVRDALNLLCSRSGVGCRYTVGKNGGQFDTLERALKTLLPKEKEISLCLLPDDHEFTGDRTLAPSEGVHLSLCGLGPATRLHIAGQYAHFQRFSSISISDMEITTSKSPGALKIQECQEFRMERTAVYGYNEKEESLVVVLGSRNTALVSNTLEAAVPESMHQPLTIFKASEQLTSLFRDSDRDAFESKLQATAAEMAKLLPEPRHALIDAITTALGDRELPLSIRERRSYADLTAWLALDKPQPEDIADRLRSIRREAVRQNSGVALNVVDAFGDWWVRDCDFAGAVSIYNSPLAGPFTDQLVATLEEKSKAQTLKFVGNGSTLTAEGCRIARIDVGLPFIQKLQEILKQPEAQVVDGVFSSIHLADCTFTCPSNQLAAESVNLSSNVFDLPWYYVPPTHVEITVAATVAGNASVFTGNQCLRGAAIRNIVPPDWSTAAANLRLSIAP